MRLTTDGKRQYSVFLNVEKAEFIRPYLKRAGITLSSFLGASVEELYDMIKEANLRDPANMSGPEFLRFLADMMERVKRDPEG